MEYPCQNRNAAGVANALIAAEMALADLTQLIPFDEMLETMYTVGKRLPAELRETAMGGCATAPSACAACICAVKKLQHYKVTKMLGGAIWRLSGIFCLYAIFVTVQ